MNIKLSIISPGLGNVSRGFEAAAANWFDAIKSNKDLSVDLCAGGGWRESKKIWNFPRNGKFAKFIRKLNLINDGCRLEQISFGLGILPFIYRRQPDVIWLQEGTLGEILLKYKKWFGFKYKIIFCDGAPLGHDFARKFDYIMFLHSYALLSALEMGISSDRCVVIPYISNPPTTKLSKSDAREKLNIEVGRFVIICVAAWNRHHKRIDYLIKEVSNSKLENVTLLLCGQEEKETADLKFLAEKYNVDARWHTFTQDELSVAYRASDLFILPSLNEGLGLVMIEAGMHDLPIISHPHEGSKFILNEDYEGLTDLSGENNLARKIKSFYHSQQLAKLGKNTGSRIRERFNRDELTRNFIDFVKQAIR